MINELLILFGERIYDSKIEVHACIFDICFFCGCWSLVIEQDVVACAAVLCAALHKFLYIVLLVDIEKISEDSLNMLCL